MVSMSRRKLEPSIETGFAKRLAELRTQRGITQTQLAEITGLTQRTISHYETGAGYPPAPTVVELAHALNVTTDQLLGAKPMKKIRSDKMTPDQQRLWKKFQQVAKWPDKDQRAVIRLINSVSEARI